MPRGKPTPTHRPDGVGGAGYGGSAAAAATGAHELGVPEPPPSKRPRVVHSIRRRNAAWWEIDPVALGLSLTLGAHVSDGAGDGARAHLELRESASFAGLGHAASVALFDRTIPAAMEGARDLGRWVTCLEIADDDDDALACLPIGQRCRLTSRVVRQYAEFCNSEGRVVLRRVTQPAQQWLPLFQIARAQPLQATFELLTPTLGVLTIAVAVAANTKPSSLLGLVRLFHPSLAELDSEDGAGLAEGDENRALDRERHEMADAGARLRDPDGFTGQLLPFQRRAVAWMLAREHGETPPFRENVWREVPLAGGLWVDFVGGRVAWSLPADDEYAMERGGILAEEMGLGKTVEVIALILARRQDPPPAHWPASASLPLLKATLIITPTLILDQWHDEFRAHAPGLRVLHYDGIRKGQCPITADELCAADVLTTSYEVLRREYYIALASTRTTRASSSEPHAGTAPQRATPSPLTSYCFTRICLDEAQMVESTTTKAAGTRTAPAVHRGLNIGCADLAQRLAGIHRWAVTGTPYGPNGIEDVAGLVRFVRQAPIADPDVWRSLVRSQRARLLSHVRAHLWRSSKHLVQAEVALADPIHATIYVHLSRVEAFYYTQLRDQLARRATAQAVGAGDGSDDEDIDAVTSHMLRRLRQACSYPQLGATDEGAPERSMADVLRRMTRQAVVRAGQTERAACANAIEQAMMIEISKDFDAALRAYALARERIARGVEEARRDAVADADGDLHADDDHAEEGDEAGEADARKGTLVDDRGVARAADHVDSLRHWLELQHTVIFNMASVHLHMDRPADKAISDDLFEQAEKVRAEIMERVTLRANAAMERLRAAPPLALDKDDPSGRALLIDATAYKAGLTLTDVFDLLADAVARLNENATALLDVRRRIHELLLTELHIDYERDAQRQASMDELGTLNGKLAAARSRYVLAHLHPALSSIRIRASQLESTREGAHLAAVAQRLAADIEVQEKALARLRQDWRLLSQADARRIEYYRLLQRLSDRVAIPAVAKPLDALARLQAESRALDLESVRAAGRLRYLLHLAGDDGQGAAQVVERTCTICTSQLERGVLTPCGHVFCQHCIGMWMRRHASCPVCKAHVAEDDLHRWTAGSEGPAPQERSLADDKQAGRPQHPALAWPAVLIGSHSSKVTAVLRLLRYITAHDPAAKAIVFSQWDEFLQILEGAFTENGIGSARVTSNAAKRSAAIQRFKTDEAARVLLLSATTQSSGLTLIAATHVIFTEPLLNPATELQAIGRVHRIGQTRQTYVYHLVAANTIEERIAEIANQRRLKLERADGGHVQHHKGAAPEAVSARDLKFLFQQQASA